MTAIESTVYSSGDALEKLFGLPDETSWQERAICSQTDPEVFFPEKGGSTREAKKICVGCEVRSECLEYALDKDERFGIWGGLSERERRRVKRTEDKPAVRRVRHQPVASALFTAAPTRLPQTGGETTYSTVVSLPDGPLVTVNGFIPWEPVSPYGVQAAIPKFRISQSYEARVFKILNYLIQNHYGVIFDQSINRPVMELLGCSSVTAANMTTMLIKAGYIGRTFINVRTTKLIWLRQSGWDWYLSQLLESAA